MGAWFCSKLAEDNSLTSLNTASKHCLPLCHRNKLPATWYFNLVFKSYKAAEYVEDNGAILSIVY